MLIDEATTAAELDQLRAELAELGELVARVGCIEVKGRRAGRRVRLTTNEWYKAQQLGDTYWLYVAWDPLENPDAVPVMVRNPARHLDYAKKEVVAARYYDVPASAVERAAQDQREGVA